MGLVADLNELRGDAHAAAGAADAPFQYVRDAELAADLLDGLVGRLVRHRRRARDDAEPGRVQAPELRDHLLGEPVAERVVLSVAAQMLEGQHDQERASFVVRLQLRDLGDETVAALRNRLDELLAERPSQQRNVRRQRAVLDGGIGRDLLKEVLPPDRRAAVLDQQDEDVDRLRRELDPFLVAKEQPRLCIQAETAKRVLPPRCHEEPFRFR